MTGTPAPRTAEEREALALRAEIFEALIALGDQREAVLSLVTAGAPDLRTQVRTLLDCSDAAAEQVLFNLRVLHPDQQAKYRAEAEELRELLTH